VKIENNGDSLGKRIRNAEMMKIPYMLVIGDKEVGGEDMAVRRYGSKEQKMLSKENFVGEILAEIKERKLR
jgi:threonyl-tRNA synthetase